MIHQSRDTLKAKRRTKGWVLARMEEIFDSKRCRQIIDPHHAPPKGFDPIAWSAVFKLAVFMNEQRSNISGLFRRFDKDGSGEIDTNEFGALLKQVGIQLHAGEVDALMRQFDVNNDGRIQYSEILSSLKMCNCQPEVEHTFPEIVMHVLSGKYGMPGLVDQYAWDLLCNVECFRAEHKLIELFGDFLGERLGPSSLGFFLFTRALVPSGVSYDFSSRRQMGASPDNKSLISGSRTKSAQERHIHTPQKYLPYEMVPGETDRQVVFTAEQPYIGKGGSKVDWPLAQQVNKALMSPAVCLSICKRLGTAYSCLEIESFLEFIDASAFEATSGKMDLEAAVIPVEDFIHFAVHHHHAHGRQEAPPTKLPAGGAAVPCSPPRVDGTAARNEISSAVNLLRQEVERRVVRIAGIKEAMRREEKASPPAELNRLQEEVFTRLRMLGTLGLTDSELDALQENHFVNYVQERSCAR